MSSLHLKNGKVFRMPKFTIKRLMHHNSSDWLMLRASCYVTLGKQQKTTGQTMATPAAATMPWPDPQALPSLRGYHPQLASPSGGQYPITGLGGPQLASPFVGQHPFVGFGGAPMLATGAFGPLFQPAPPCFAGFGGSGASAPLLAPGAFSPIMAGLAASGSTFQQPPSWTPAEKASTKAAGTGSAAGEAVDSVEGLDGPEDLFDGTEEAPGGPDAPGEAVSSADGLDDREDGDVTEKAPGGVDEAVTAGGVEGEDTRETRDLMQELSSAGITDAAATKAVQQLRSDLLTARKLGMVEEQHDAAVIGIDTFKATPYGIYANQTLRQRGFVITPVLSEVDKDETPRFMSETVAEQFFTEKSKDGQLRVPYSKGLRKINSQERWMVDLEDPVNKKRVGEDFMAKADAAVETLGFVLQALDYGVHNVVDAEKLTLLLSAAGTASQVLHKDQPGEDVTKRVKGGSGSGTRGRGEPPPYTGICAFQDPVYLHVLEGSHKRYEKMDYDWSDMEEVMIPPGYGILFHCCLVHSGSSYEKINSRLHIYFKCKNGLTTFDKTFCQVDHDETKQPAARRALPLS